MWSILWCRERRNRCKCKLGKQRKQWGVVRYDNSNHSCKSIRLMEESACLNAESSPADRMLGGNLFQNAAAANCIVARPDCRGKKGMRNRCVTWPRVTGCVSAPAMIEKKLQNELLDSECRHRKTNTSTFSKYNCRRGFTRRRKTSGAVAVRGFARNTARRPARWSFCRRVSTVLRRLGKKLLEA